MNADNILFRCSSLGHIMTEPKLKGEVLSETCKTHLVDKFVSVKYGRNTDIQNRYTIKGNMVEEDSLTLYSRYKKEFYKKNDQRLQNLFISGTPDIILPDEVKDIKSSWDIYTFFRNTTSKLNKLYYWQLLGYMILTNTQKATLAYCLVNTPDILIADEKRKLSYKMGIIDSSHDYELACKEIELLSIYDDIPINEKIIEINIERNKEDEARLYQRIIECRKYMNTILFKAA